MVVTVHVRVFHARLEGSRQPEINGEIDEVEAEVATDLCRGIVGAVIDDDIFIFRCLLLQFLYRARYTCFLVVGGDNYQR